MYFKTLEHKPINFEVKTLGSHWDWKTGKTWKNKKAFSRQGKVGEFCQDWKNQGILLKILEKSEKIILEN